MTENAADPEAGQAGQPEEGDQPATPTQDAPPEPLTEVFDAPVESTDQLVVSPGAQSAAQGAEKAAAEPGAAEATAESEAADTAGGAEAPGESPPAVVSPATAGHEPAAVAQETAGQESPVASPAAAGQEAVVAAPETAAQQPVVAAPGAAMRNVAEGLEEPFASFYAHYGPTLCGRPLGEVVVEEGRRRQYFGGRAVEEHEPRRVRLVRLGEAWLAIRQGQQAARGGRAHPVTDISRSLRRDPSQHYAARPLCDIRYLVIHHTGASAAFGPEAIARAHVEDNGWPGIGYHFVVDPAGTIYHTQDLTVVSYHARQFNPASVGIAVMGDLTSAQPTPAQLEATADLIASLLFDLGLPLDAVRGHREMVPTPCPGDAFLRVWRPRLMAAVQERIDARQAERLSQLAAGALSTT